MENEKCITPGETIIVPLNENTPPTILVSAEQFAKLRVKHKCKGGVTIEFPKHIYIPSGYPKDYAPTGFVRINEKSAKLVNCPICGELIAF